MHIGFDISQTGASKAGCGYFAHALARSLVDIGPQHRYSLFPSFGDFYFDALMPLRNPHPGRDVRYGPRHFSRETARAFWCGERVEAALGQPDIIHSNNFWCPVQLQSARLVYTLYDMSFAVEPSWTTEANRIGCFEGVFRSSVAADWVVAISEASRNDYLRIFPHFPEDRMRVIYPCSRFAAADRLGVRPKALDGIPEDGFWLSVGTIEPRKNQRRLVEAYARYRSCGGAPMPLVLAGGKGWLMGDFQRHLEDLGIAREVVMTGYVSDDELIWLYRNCCANLYPSLFEGFGLPVLEGMQFGAATLSSNTSALPEVGGKAAVLLAPEDTDAWADAMFKLGADRDRRNMMRRASQAQAARFSWQDSTKQLLQLYEEAIALPKRNDLGQV